MSNFIDKCIDGLAIYEEIDDYVAEWHDGKSDLPLHEYLGMTREEYKLWVSDASILPVIITAHRLSTSLDELLNDKSEYALAARSRRPQEYKEIEQWLKDKKISS